MEGGGCVLLVCLGLIRSCMVHMGPQGSTGVHMGPQGSTGVCMGPQGSTGVHMGPQGSTGVHMGPQGSAWVHRGPHGSTGVHMGPQGSAWVHRGPQGSAWVHRGPHAPQRHTSRPPPPSGPRQTLSRHLQLVLYFKGGFFKHRDICIEMFYSDLLSIERSEAEGEGAGSPPRGGARPHSQRKSRRGAADANTAL